jgi:hypothetical protein
MELRAASARSLLTPLAVLGRRMPGQIRRAAIVLLLGVAFCFVMYAWQLRYAYAAHGLAINLLVALPFVGLALMVLGGMGRVASALGWLVLAGLTGIAYIAAATSSSSTAAVIFIVPFLYGTIANSIIFAIDTILRNRRQRTRDA